MKRFASLVVGVAVAALSSAAFAQRPAPAAPAAPAPASSGSAAAPADDICKRVMCVGEVTIVGRVQKPFALAEVSRIQPKLTLAELRQPFLDRIEEAVLHDPF